MRTDRRPRGRAAMWLLAAMLAATSLAIGQTSAPATTRAADESSLPPVARRTISLDAGWRFIRGDPDNAASPAFDDAGWSTVDVPHDWSIAGPFAQDAPTRGSGAFLPSGVAWYRRTLDVAPPADGGRVYLELDGAMHRSDVYVNGTRVAGRPNGYLPIQCDVTDQLRAGGPNVLAVRVDTSQQPASRWYSGAGIYRHARLIVTPAVHLVPDGASVFPSFVLAEQATVATRAEILNRSSAPREVALRADIVAPDGRVVTSGTSASRLVGAGQVEALDGDVWVPRPERWDVGKGAMYVARLSVVDAKTNEVIDRQSNSFGIREAIFTPDRGFLLNGRPIKLKGVCLHHDGGMVGAAVPLAVWADRLRTLQSIGVNAVRTAHNPPAPRFLDLCDSLGILVMDELFDAWTVGKNRYDYHVEFLDWSRRDVRDAVRRDRNHPSVILWSAGNEIHDTPRAALANGILKSLVETFHENDPYRPVTQALFRPNASHDYDNGLADLLDVVGQNYRENELLAAADQKPTRSIVGTETNQSRQAWLAMRDDARFSGQFLWAGVDYLGESRQWPQTTFTTALLDRTGAMKPMAYERQSWWSDAPMVHVTRRVAPTARPATDPGYEPNAPRRSGPTLFDDWTPRSSEPHEETVEVYSNAAEVELFLNDASLGAKPLNADASPRTWKVAYAPGTLRAVARDAKGNEVARDALRTAGPAAALKVTVDRDAIGLGFDAVAIVRVEVVDADGTRVPDATQKVTFDVANGTVVAVDNADPRSLEPFLARERTAFQGRCVALVRASTAGPVEITARADGLKSGVARVEANATEDAR